MYPDELISATATRVVALLRDGAVTPHDLLDALERRIEQVDPVVNALPTRFLDRARVEADALLRRGTTTATADVGRWLAGLPVAVKDTCDVAGIATTRGSPIFADAVAAESGATVRQIEASGGVPYAKSNLPEFAAGGHTYNPLFGITRNPWNTGLTAGGSSGGSAAALASGTAWLATGSDLGGSLRTPAGYCGVVGVRPSPGRVPRERPVLPFDTLSVSGPMGRTVADAALLLDAMAGFDPHDPLTTSALPPSFAERLGDGRPPRRVAYAPTLGGVPVEPAVRDGCQQAAAHFERLGATVVEAQPDLTGAYEAFHALRAQSMAVSLGPVADAHPGEVKDDVVWNVKRGRAQDTDELLRAEEIRGRVYHAMVDFLADYDLLVCPSAQVMPFPVEWTWPHEIEGTEQRTYIDWIAITFFLTLTGCPIVALPGALSPDRLPIGVQLVGRPRDEARLLSYAAAFEQEAGIAELLPLTPA